MQGYGYDFGSGPWMHGGWMFGGGWMTILWLLLIAIGVAFALDLFRRSHTALPAKSPLDILKERYARGEIEKDEFDRKKRELA